MIIYKRGFAALEFEFGYEICWPPKPLRSIEHLKIKLKYVVGRIDASSSYMIVFIYTTSNVVTILLG